MRVALLVIHPSAESVEQSDSLPRRNQLFARSKECLDDFREREKLIIHLSSTHDCDDSPDTSDGILQPANDESTCRTCDVHRLTELIRDHQCDAVALVGGFIEESAGNLACSVQRKGYQVWMIDDAIGALDPAHAEILRIRLAERGVRFVESHELQQPDTTLPTATSESRDCVVPAANIDGQSVRVKERHLLTRRNPAHWDEIIARIPIACDTLIAEACSSAASRQRDWSKTPSAVKEAILERWANALAENAEQLACLMCLETGKPMPDSRDEVQRAVAHIRTAKRLCAAVPTRNIDAPKRVSVAQQPLGVVAILTPWNNPVAIPVGKIAPALACGNSVVWKPAIEAPRTALAVAKTWHEAADIDGLVNVVFGNAVSARALIDHPDVSGVALTGSFESGQSAAVRCLRRSKPLQAELGGNNAAIVWRDTDVEGNARSMARSAFSFAGQRCTAIRRFIVDSSIVDVFTRELLAATESLRLGDPSDEATDVGPLISRNHLEWVCDQIQRARDGGGRLLYGGTTPQHLQHGCWLEPTVIDNVSPHSKIAQQETFGPVAVILPADGFEQALEIANGVQQGLAATLYSESNDLRRRFSETIKAGIVKLTPGPLQVHQDAPFGGWKSSSLGPPEHGDWDSLFYLRPQAVYGAN